MKISLTGIFVTFFLLMLAVLGHGAWHKELTGLIGIGVTLLTGAHVSG